MNYSDYTLNPRITINDESIYIQNLRKGENYKDKIYGVSAFKDNTVIVSIG